MRPRRAILLLYGLAGLLSLALACTPGATAPTAPAAGSGGATNPSAPPLSQSAPAPTAPPPLLKARFGYAAISSYQAHAILARDAGLFQKHGLDVELVYLAGSSRATQGLLGGDADFVFISGDSAVSANLNGADTVMIGGGASIVVHNLLVTPDVRSGEDLRGKSVGLVTFGSVPHFGAVYALRKMGLQPGADVTLVQVAGNPEVLAALQSGAIAGGMLTTPLLSQGEAMGMHVLYDLKGEKVPYPSLAIASTRGYLARNEPTAVAFLEAMLEATHLYKTDRARATQLLRDVTKVDDPALLDETLNDTLPNLDDIPYPTVRGTQNVLDWLGESDPKAQGMKAEQFIDDRLMRQIEASGFPQTIGITASTAPR
jgi:NitT/TauT family transport system substrate-binding protein